VIFTKLSGGQLDESGLTLEDLRIITMRMASTLVNMYHGRIKYPWQREADRASSTTPNPALVSSSSSLPVPVTPLPTHPTPKPPAQSAVATPVPAEPGGPTPRPLETPATGLPEA
jgi:hypothetical protein